MGGCIYCTGIVCLVFFFICSVAIIRILTLFSISRLVVNRAQLNSMKKRTVSLTMAIMSHLSSV